MYIPDHFAETDVAVMHEIMEQSPLGALVLATPSGLSANHVPFQIDRHAGELGTLRCHVARANDIWKYAEGAECLVLFEGPSTYISPSLYVTKKENGKVVPTYNYVAVHAHGRIAVHDDRKWLRALVGHLTHTFEAPRPEPWKMGDAPQDYLEEMLGKIVGLEIAITRLEGKWKMSQNRSEADRSNVAAKLIESENPADRAVAKIVEERNRRG
jgi:transcriptional regulator